MRKIIESTLVSLDGVIGDPHLWAMVRFDDDAQKEALEGLRASDAMLMGRRTYEIFAGIWPARTGAYADRIKARDFDAVQVERRRVGSGVLVESFPPWRASYRK